VLFLTLTGARSGEAQKLKIADLELERGYATLRKTKNGKPRQVALAPDLIAAMQDQLAALDRGHGGKAPADTLVFECETRWGIPQIVKRAQKRAGLPRHRPHEIGRHAFATRLLHDGASLMDVQKAGGWEKAQMVTEYYGHLAQEHVDKVVSGQSLKVARLKPAAKRSSGGDTQ
jgi:integrase